MGIQVIGHTSFLGHTGYNNHSRNFFTHLNNYIPTRIRNYTHVSDLSYLKKEEHDLIIQQNLDGHPRPIGRPFTPNPKDTLVNIVLNESHHYYFYDKYDSPMIAYNVWESTKQLPEFFNRILEYDQFWCPTEWQRQCTIDQGYPADRVKVVPEAVNGNIFQPPTNPHGRIELCTKYNIPSTAFIWMIFGRWDYRKATEEMIRAWINVFGKNEKCYLVLSVDNPFGTDGMKTTEERLKHHKLEHERIKVLHFPPRDEYVKWMQHGECLLSCSRSEGWNLPLMEALACGTPSICSDWGGHLEFADGIAYKVQVPKELPPKQVYMIGDNHDLGVWGEPDFYNLEYIMQYVYDVYDQAKSTTLALSKHLRRYFTWDNAARQAEHHIKELVTNKYHDMKPAKLPDLPPDMELYQDQYVNGEVIVKGKRDCESRYKAMQPLFEKYKRPFTILDIGANFGYYSIRAASEYGATSVMFESEKNEVNTLLNLAEQNDCRDNLTILNTRLNLHKLKEIGKCEHFDVVFALNVIHHFDSKEILEVCKTFTELGDYLILETPPVNDSGACGQNNLEMILKYFEGKESTELGEFKRHTSDTYSHMKLIETKKTILEWPYYEYEELFTREGLDVEGMKNREVGGAKCLVESDFYSKKINNPRKTDVINWIPGINLLTFVKLNGLYPSVNTLTEKIRNRNIIGDYKWDNSNKDIIIHNFILNGTNLHMIDFDDHLIGDIDGDDQEQLEYVINQINKAYNPDKIKINLGCGNVIKSGYINIDKYNNTNQVDLKCDLNSLPFKDGSVDEIYTAHVFEHIELNDVYAVLEEWERALRLGGELVMRLPNLEIEIKNWLNTPDDRKWFELHRIFGSQSHPGNTHYNGHNPNSLKMLIERFNFKVTSLVGNGNRGYGPEIQMTAKKIERTPVKPATYITHFVDGPFGEVLGDPNDKGFYVLDFLDLDNDSHVHQQILGINCWTRPHRKYYTNWLVTIKRNGKPVYEHRLDLTGKRVMVSFDSKSIGDSIAWIPQVEAFRKKHECEVFVSTFWNHLFLRAYPQLHFVPPGQVLENLYASYSVGCYEGNYNKNKIDWREVPLQKVCSDVLGLEYKEIVADLGIKPEERPIEEKYVTLSEFSTFQCKFWNYEGGWQEIVDYLNELGYKVAVVSKEATKLKNILDWTNKPMHESINNIAHSEFYMGVSAGPSWLAWALKKPVVMISGFSLATAEFETNIQRVINENVCHGCFNVVGNNFDRGDWNWCPNHKGTDRQFECTKTITPQMVKEAIQNIIKNN